MARLARMGKASGRARVEPCLRTSRAAGVHCVTDCVADCYCRTRDPMVLRRSNMKWEFSALGRSADATLMSGMFRASLHALDGLALQARPGGARLHPGSLREVAEPAGIVLLEPGDCL